MLTLLLGTDWTANRDTILDMIAKDVAQKKRGVILMVPELISHDTERRLCAAAGDTASRFSEVLTFTRLVKRVSDVAGIGAPVCLDNGGRLVAMASATKQLHSKLKAYASVETRPEFLAGLLDAVDEFKRCCISTADLLAASKKTEGSFAQKLEELALIMDAYDAICAQGKCDPRDQMTWLLEQMENCSFAADHTFYIDGFPDFTRQHSAILKHLIANSVRVVVSLTCDRVGTENPAFEKAGNTAADLLCMAKELGVDMQIQQIKSGASGVRPLLSLLFQGHIGQVDADDTNLLTYQTDSLSAECHAAANAITELVQGGDRYRDISVVCTDMVTYGNTLNMIFSRYHIPTYQSGNDDILSKTIITTILSAIDAAVDGFEQADVLRYLRSPLSPLSVSQCDKVENYAILWQITGNRWGSVWTNNPSGLGSEWKESDRVLLDELEGLRGYAMEPLIALARAMKDAVCLSQMIGGLYAFLNAMQLDTRLDEMSQKLELAGDLRNSQILGQLWEILLDALEQLDGMLGDTHWDSRAFTRLLKLILSQYDVGTIPTVLDAVTVGPFSAMRCHQTKHLLVLGANEGMFPAYSGTTGVLSDQERTTLRQMGVPLTGGAMEGLQAEFADIYGSLCGADQGVSVFCSGSQPSFLYRRICQMSGEEKIARPVGFATTDAGEVCAYLVRSDNQILADALGLKERYATLKADTKHEIGELSADMVKNLYGSTLHLSASQVDKLADCRMAYFLHYGIRLKERKPATVDPAEFGTYVHAVLEDTCRKVMEMGGFHQISLEQTLEIANGFSAAYITERFNQIDSQRLSYLFRRNVQELEMIVRELWDELRLSEFSPVAFELSVGKGGQMDAVNIVGQTMAAQLRGFVDRVDAWTRGNQTFYRVVDYKTGKKDFDYCDIYNGLGLQMLLYLFAREDNGSAILGDRPVVSGVQYFPARAPIVPLDGKPDAQEAAQAREKLWKRKGLILSDEDVLRAMEPTEKPRRLSYKQKDGVITGDVADSQQFRLLKGYVFALIGKMVDDIASGCVEPNPYTRGGRHNACAFCPFGAICHKETVTGRRDFAAISADKFWADIGKEMNKGG